MTEEQEYINQRELDLLLFGIHVYEIVDSKKIRRDPTTIIIEKIKND